MCTPDAEASIDGLADGPDGRTVSAAGPQRRGCRLSPRAPESLPDRFRVRTERSREMGDSTRRARQLGCDAGDQERFVEPLVLHRHDHVAGLELRIGDDVSDAVDSTDRDLVLTQQGHERKIKPLLCVFTLQGWLFAPQSLA